MRNGDVSATGSLGKFLASLFLPRNWKSREIDTRWFVASLPLFSIYVSSPSKFARYYS